MHRGLGGGLRRGTRFDCIRVIHGNVEMLTGIVEVRDVNDKWAECNVVSVIDGLDPIMPGDYVRNRIYDPKRTREFVLAGAIANTRSGRRKNARSSLRLGSLSQLPSA